MFGFDAPDLITDTAIHLPQTLQGMQDVVGAYLISDYSRKGFFINGAVCRRFMSARVNRTARRQVLIVQSFESRWIVSLSTFAWIYSKSIDTCHCGTA